MSLLPSFIGFYAVIISSLYFFLPLYLQGSLGFTGGQIGLIYGVLTLTAILVSFPVGVTADRYPARNLTRLGLVGIAACLWGLSEVRHFWTFLLVIFASGISLQFFRLSLDSLLFKENSDDASRRFGHYNSWRMGGMMLGALGGGTLIYSLDFPWTLKLLGLGVLALLFLTAKLPRSPGVRTPLLQYGRDFLSKPVLFFVAWLFLFTLHWGAEATSLALFLKNNLRLSTPGIGGYMAGEFATVGLTAYAYGRFWAGRLKPLQFLTVALIASGAGHILMTYPSLPWSFGWRLIHGFGDGLILMETYTTIARLFHVDRIGGNASLISLTTTLGTFAGSLMFGPIGAGYGYAWPLIISGGISLALLPLAYMGLREGAVSSKQWAKRFAGSRFLHYPLNITLCNQRDFRRGEPGVRPRAPGRTPGSPLRFDAALQAHSILFPN